ncbi:MAG TPA: tRNA pseudouridine(55) synthase TruB [Microthrixaceae bacterium]|jgi:tRNA pseudouridine55 synthase|nr:tRNA pseudouridine(55) synthase TruB [Microthrixaceae bacterium]
MGRRGKDSGDGPIHGVAIVDKDAGWTSHDVVAKARGILGTRKVGHSGTLDPDATGVLVLGVGRATKLLRFLQLLPKSYECEIVFGTETNTLDAAGEVTATYDMTVDPAEATAATAQFTGDIQQVPPMVSAVKIDGKRLHELARKGIEVDRPPRPVTVYRYDVEPTDDPLVYRAFVDCSSGTYVRVLAADLGHALGGGAHLRKLRRTSVGAFTLADATSLEDVTVIPMAEAVRGFPIVRVDEATEAAIRVGAVLDSAALGVAGTGPWPILSPTGELLAMYEPFGDGRVKPVVVLVG